MARGESPEYRQNIRSLYVVVLAALIEPQSFCGSASEYRFSYVRCNEQWWAPFRRDAENDIMLPNVRLLKKQLEKSYGKDESAEFLRTARHENGGARHP
jgi:hypothetical protein